VVDGTQQVVAANIAQGDNSLACVAGYWRLARQESLRRKDGADLPKEHRMKKTSITATGAVAAAAVVVAVAAPASAATTTAAKPFTAQDASFLKMSATMDLEEIAGGAVAFKKGTYPATRLLGKRLAVDHAKHYLQATVLAKANGITLPKTVPADAVAMLKAVSAKSGAAFDIAWLKMETAGHFEAVAATTKEIERGSQMRVVKNAQAASPIIRYHLWRAQLDLRYELWDQGR